MLSASLADFVKDMTGYRITVSFMAQGIMRTSPIEIDWKGQWETVQVRGVESVLLAPAIKPPQRSAASARAMVRIRQNLG
jgi:hypothetical protein